ncbi:MAG TPA: cupin domain-containing protein [Candidatus Limnocylindrales bacterium]|nr:cupin domain-containing protein [Candidatus Limnocylindrales bacterium]
MEIRRFGPGHRKAEGPPGSQGVTGQVIHSDGGARISELVFQRYAMVSPHSNPNTTLFVVISGGGYVQVGTERSRINHGEAVVLPPDLPHGAFTDGSEMRAIVIELGHGGDARLLEGRAVEVGPKADHSAGGPIASGRPERAQGSLAERPKLRDEYDSSEGEPW